MRRPESDFERFLDVDVGGDGPGNRGEMGSEGKG